MRKRPQRLFSYSRDRWILAAVCLIAFVSHMLYVAQSRQYPQWDEHNYLSLAVKYYDIFRAPSWDMYARILSVTGYLQPVYSLMLSFLLLLFGTSHTYAMALAVNGIMLVATVTGIFILARELFSKEVGIVASIMYIFLGNVQFYSHFAYTETAVTAFVVWTLVSIILSRGFRRRRLAVAAGIFMALGVLTRWIAPVFIAGALFVSLFEAIRDSVTDVRTRKTRLTNIGLFALLGFGVPVLAYFLPNGRDFIGYVERNQTEAVSWVAQYRFAEMANTFSTRSVMYYFNILSQNTVGIFAAFVFGMLFSAVRLKRTAFLLAAFVVPYAFLTFIAVWKEDRFLVPIYPVFAIIAASGLFWIRSKLLKLCFIIIVIVLSVFNFLGSSWGIGPMGSRGLADIVLPQFIHHPRRVYLTPLVWPPVKELTNAHLIAEVIESSALTAPPVVLGAFTHEPLDTALKSILWYHRRTLMDYKNIPWDGLADFIITKSNDAPIGTFVTPHLLAAYTPIANIPVPMDNSTVTIYQYDAQ